MRLNSDPSQTITIRRMFSAQFDKRFRRIRGLIRQSIDDNDCFGLKKANILSSSTLESNPLLGKIYKFKTNPDKISLFMVWLKQVQKEELFELASGNDFLRGVPGAEYNIWQNLYLYSAYKKGVKWSRQQMKRDKVIRDNIAISGLSLDTDDASIIDSLNGPVPLEELRSLYLRSFTDLNGINEAVDAEVTRVLVDGFASGWNPRRIATEINKKVETVGRRRASLLARTEVIRAHHLAAIRQYEDFGITGTKVTAEWTTANDSRVCSICAPLDFKRTGKIWPLNEIRGMIPAHPLCRCVALPHLDIKGS